MDFDQKPCRYTVFISGEKKFIDHSFYQIHIPPVDLYLNFEILSLNLICLSSLSWIFAGYTGSKNKVLQTWFFKLRNSSTDQQGDYSKAPIIRTRHLAVLAVHSVYCRTGIRTGTYNRNFRVSGSVFSLSKVYLKV